LQQFLHRDWLLVEWMVRIKRAKDVIDGMKKYTVGDTVMVGIALNEVAKVVNVHVSVIEWTREWLGTRHTKDGEQRRHAHSSRRRRRCIHIGWRHGTGVGRGLRDCQRQLQGGWIHIGRRHPDIKGLRISQRVL
jgi:hypothetical protein